MIVLGSSMGSELFDHIPFILNKSITKIVPILLPSGGNLSP